MKSFTIKEVARHCGGELRQGLSETKVLRLHHDTRTLQPGDAYVALKGEQWDGHSFLSQAIEAGAVAAIVSHLPEGTWPDGFGWIQVQDTLEALQRFSGYYRSLLPVRVIGITGSSGKTSTKEMVASILRQRFSTHATQGNWNNHVGVPLTLLGLEPEHEFAVIEMGMNHPGEIGMLAGLAKPEIGVITNIGTAHIEFFEDSSGIAQEKSELLMALPQEGVALLPSEDPYLEYLRGRTQAKVLLGGGSELADWHSEKVEVTPQGIRFDLCHKEKRQTVALPLFSRPMVNNALLAAAVGSWVGLEMEEIVRGLETVSLPGHRMKVSQLPDGRWIINDAYNANADSMQASLQALREIPCSGRKVAVLGSMGELGTRSSELHALVGKAAARMKVDGLILLGPHSSDMETGALQEGIESSRVKVCSNQGEAFEVLKGWFDAQGDCLLVKGSRFMQLDQLVARLLPSSQGGSK